MLGYFKNEEATKEVIDAQGYFHSGDLGKYDERGFLLITGRIKELIITAGGENVAPILIEDQVKLACPYVNNIMVVGENKKFVSALITLKTELDLVTQIPSKELTQEAQNYFKKELGIEIKTSDEAIQNEKVMKLLQEGIEKANLKAVSRSAVIKKWRVLPMDFSLPGGEFTPTLKLKRKTVELKYKDIINSMYEEE